MSVFMKSIAFSVSVTFFAGAGWAASEFPTEREKQSYAIGVNVAKRLQQQGVSFDPEMVSKGFLAEMSGKSLLTDSEIVAVLDKLQREVQQKNLAARKQAAIENRQRGTAFMAENGKKEGVKTLAGGVQYQVLKAGDGEKPNDEDTVLCNYRGMLVNGTVFDTTPPGQPASLVVAEVIPGWREALKQMPVGSKWELAIPPERAYGERGAGTAIGPNETLIFEVELVGIE